MPGETASQFSIHDTRTSWYRKLVVPDDWDSDLPA